MGQITKTNFGIHKRTILTNAEVIALPTTAIQLVAGIAGKILLPVCAWLRLDWTANYTNIDAACILNIGGTWVFLAYLDQSISNDTKVSKLLADGADRSAFLGPLANIKADVAGMTVAYGQSGGIANADVEGQSLDLIINNGGSGNFTGGDVANRLIVDVFYNVIEPIPVA